MTSGVLGIIGCPMLEDNLIHCLRDDSEEEDITEHMTPEMMEMLGIEPGQDGYMRWLLSLGHYEHMLKLDNGIGNEGFDENLANLAERTRLDIRDAEPGWANIQLTVDLYARCKSLLGRNPGSGE